MFFFQLRDFEVSLGSRTKRLTGVVKQLSWQTANYFRVKLFDLLRVIVRLNRVATISRTQNALPLTHFPGSNLIFFPDNREILLRCKKKIHIVSLLVPIWLLSLSIGASRKWSAVGKIALSDLLYTKGLQTSIIIIYFKKFLWWDISS